MPVTLALRLLSYPAWRVRVDGREVGYESQPQTARMLLAVPQGTHHVDIRFRRTEDRTLGGIISALSFCVLTALVYAVRQRERVSVR
jgi:hypothetical protein